MKKRVWALYRVSTARQSESIDDIPMQRNAINKFIEKHNDWILDKEFVEVDVSGFKLKSSERNKLVEIQEGVKNKQFEVFLVFMFDRIGRRWDDSPQVVEEIVTSGVEVWSVKEGQQKFDNHVDRLINFITFWQAGGESLKTSTRVKEAMGQFNEQGRYMGGKAPYGYETYDSGIFKKDKNGKKIKELKFLRINEVEANIVRLIFNLAIDKGYGTNRIAKYLNQNNYMTRVNGKWLSNYISRILHNPIYKGYKRYHEDKENSKLQPFNADYVIIKEEVWIKIQEIMSNRKYNKVDNANINIPTKSKLLLSGLVDCGYCGQKLLTDYTIKYYVKKDGTTTKFKVTRYYCRHRKNLNTNFKHEITQFGTKKYETEVLLLLENKLSQIDFSMLDELIEENIENGVAEKKTELAKRKQILNEKENESNALKSLRIKVELGQSKLSSDYVENMMLTCDNEIEQLKESVKILDEEITQEQLKLNSSSEIKDLYQNWKTIFYNADFDRQKVILAKVIKHISFKKNEIDLELELI